MQVNLSPALGVDCDADPVVKKPMLHDLFDLLGMPVCNTGLSLFRIWSKNTPPALSVQLRRRQEEQQRRQQQQQQRASSVSAFVACPVPDGPHCRTACLTPPASQQTQLAAPRHAGHGGQGSGSSGTEGGEEDDDVGPRSPRRKNTSATSAMTAVAAAGMWRRRSQTASASAATQRHASYTRYRVAYPIQVPNSNSRRSHMLMYMCLCLRHDPVG